MTMISRRSPPAAVQRAGLFERMVAEFASVRLVRVCAREVSACFARQQPDWPATHRDCVAWSIPVLAVRRPAIAGGTRNGPPAASTQGQASRLWVLDLFGASALSRPATRRRAGECGCRHTPRLRGKHGARYKEPSPDRVSRKRSNWVRQGRAKLGSARQPATAGSTSPISIGREVSTHDGHGAGGAYRLLRAPTGHLRPGLRAAPILMLRSGCGGGIRAEGGS